MSHKTITVLVVAADDPHALGRLLARCHARGWAPVALRSVSDGARCEVTMRLRVQADRRGTEAQVHAQLARLVGVEHVAVDTAEGELRTHLPLRPAAVRRHLQPHRDLAVRPVGDAAHRDRDPAAGAAADEQSREGAGAVAEDDENGDSG